MNERMKTRWTRWKRGNGTRKLDTKKWHLNKQENSLCGAIFWPIWGNYQRAPAIIDIGRLKDYLPFYQTINALLDRLFMNSIWPMISMSMTIIAMITYCSRSLKLKPIYHIYTYIAQYLHSIRYAHIWTVDVFFCPKIMPIQQKNFVLPFL